MINRNYDREEFTIRLILVIAILLLGLSLMLKADTSTGYNIFIPGIGTICPHCTQDNVAENITASWTFSDDINLGDPGVDIIPYRAHTNKLGSPTNYFDDLYSESAWLDYLYARGKEIVMSASMGILIDGQADDEQLTVQGHSTQTANIFVVEKSNGNDLFSITNGGATSINAESDVVNLTLRASSLHASNLFNVTNYGGTSMLNISPTGKITSNPGDFYSNTKISLVGNGTSGGGAFYSGNVSGSGAFFSIQGTGAQNFTGASVDQQAFAIRPRYNQTGTSGATDLLIDRTEIAVGSGSQYLIDAQVGGASKFSVDNTGVVTTKPGTVQIGPAWQYDAIPASPNALDDEFNDGTFSGWTTHGGGACVPDESTYPGYIYFTGDCYPEEDGFLTKAVSLAGDFNFVIKASTLGGDGNGNARARVCVLDASGNGHCAGIRSYTTLGYRCSYGTVSAYAVTETNLAQYGYEIKYLSIRRDSGVIYYCYSGNGMNWYCPASASDSTTFTQAGLHLYGQNGSYAIFKPNGSVDFFRRVN